ncbi:MAG TPA: hypothetical protein PL033_08930 [Candidatus Brocadiia bacterium]|nr:hypothetical protein [Candidatus Brocadiia bacterium]
MTYYRFAAALALILAQTACRALSADETAHADAMRSFPTIGAIRWDAWFEGNDWQGNLAPAQWHSRLPFYAKILPDGGVEIRSDSQETMDREIACATTGGLDYWAFCYYHPSSWKGADSYNYGWRLFRQSENKLRLRYCLILQGRWLGPPDQWPDTIRLFCEMFSGNDYLKVCGNRPLVYVFGCEDVEARFGSAAQARSGFDALRAAAIGNGSGSPYIVAQVFSAKDGVRHLENYGFDAIGAYSAPGWGRHEELPYSELAAANLRFMEQLRETGKPVVPLVNSGWDARPRLIHPRFTETYKGPWHAQPAPDEFAENVRAAIRWTGNHPVAAESGTVLIYAWNENDEGGWLVPTLSEGAARLDALAGMLKSEREASRLQSGQKN